jgi:hypothetical protein
VRRRPWTRRLAALAGTALLSTGLGAAPAPVAAAPEGEDGLAFVSARGAGLGISMGSMGSVGSSPVGRVDHAVAGDFSAAPGSGVLLYAAGSAPDGVLHVEPSGSGYETSFTAKRVDGTYTPLVGDLDGNGIDDVLWYAPGSRPDSIWRFAADGSHTVVPVSIAGTYQPLVLDADGDGDDDVLWYAPGRAADSLWRFGAGAVHAVRSVRIDGTYRLTVGRFGDAGPEEAPERVAFLDRDGRGSIWTFDTDAEPTSRSFTGAGWTWVPVVGDLHGTGRDDILWYGPGGAIEGLTRFDAGGTATIGAGPPVNGTYVPVVLDADGDGGDDIAWTTGGRATVWLFGDTPPGWPYPSHIQRSVTTGIADGLPVALDGSLPA